MAENESTVKAVSLYGEIAAFLVPLEFGGLDEIAAISDSYNTVDEGKTATELVLDFALTTSLHEGCEKFFEKLVERVEGAHAGVSVWWQNASPDIEMQLAAMNFGKGGKKDPPAKLESTLLGPDAMTSETRMEQDNVDDLLASLGM